MAKKQTTKAPPPLKQKMKPISPPTASSPYEEVHAKYRGLKGITPEMVDHIYAPRAMSIRELAEVEAKVKEEKEIRRKVKKKKAARKKGKK